MSVRIAATAALATAMMLGGCARPDAALTATTSASIGPQTTAAGDAMATSPAVDGTVAAADGRQRTYRLYVPAAIAASSAPVPLLVALHGGLGGGRQFEITSGFDALADAYQFIVVYPDGIGTRAGGLAGGTWNGGGCCGAAARAGVDDVGFLTALVATLAASQPIDRARVFATGHSNGGIMAYRLACEAADVFAAVGVQSASLELPVCQPSKPVSLLHIHGTADTNIPIGGGVGSATISGVDFHPPRDGVASVAAADGCPAAPAERIDPSNGDLTIDTWQPCNSGTAVEFVRVAGGAHTWMGPTASGGPDARPYLGLDSSQAIWTFLSGHPRVD